MRARPIVRSGGDLESLERAARGTSLLPKAKRRGVILLCALAAALSDMDKVIMSVAGIPLSEAYGWDRSLLGVLQGLFFFGFAVTQARAHSAMIPGGVWAARYRGARLLPLGVLIWSLATMLTPFTVRWPPALAVCRAVVGLGQGLAPTALTDVLASTVPVTERSRTVGFVFSGFNVGHVFGLLAAAALTERSGSVALPFLLFGGAGLAWAAGWNLMLRNLGADSPQSLEDGPAGLASDKVEARAILSTKGRGGDTAAGGGGGGGGAAGGAGGGAGAGGGTPWGAIMRSPSVWAVTAGHFADNWGKFTLLVWTPSMFSQRFGVGLTAASWPSVLPPIAGIAVASVATLLADKLIMRGYSVRRWTMAVALLGPAAFLAAASAASTQTQTAVALAAALGVARFSLAGLYCVHQDMCPRHAAAILGLTNTAGALAGLLGVAATGRLLEATGHSWERALFYPCIGVYAVGAEVWVVWVDASPHDIDRGPGRSGAERP